MNDAHVLFNKSTPLISKYFLRIEKPVHQKCIELLMIEVYKYLDGLSPHIISDIFKLRENTYNLWNFHTFESQNPRTKTFGLDSIEYRANQLWKYVPDEIRDSTSLPLFKKTIKKVPLISCSCNFCRKYIHHVEFIYLFYIFN